MTNIEIEEFKKYVQEVLIKKYKVSKSEAFNALKQSYLPEALKIDNDFVESDSVEEWADIIYQGFILT